MADLVVVLQDPAAGRERRPADHVLARGVAGGVVEAQEDQLVGEEAIDVGELRDARRSLRLLADLADVVVDPGDEIAAVAGVVEDEHGCPLHAVVHHRAGDAPCEVEHLDAAVVGGDERALRRGEGNEELADGMLTVDLDRPGEADGDLGDAREVLDVALGDRGIEGRTCRCAGA